jgi:hypothetical protein
MELGGYPEGTILLVGNIVPQNKSLTQFFTWRSADHGRTWDPVSFVVLQTNILERGRIDANSTE